MRESTTVKTAFYYRANRDFWVGKNNSCLLCMNCNLLYQLRA
jgi:hypothetical protein